MCTHTHTHTLLSENTGGVKVQQNEFYTSSKWRWQDIKQWYDS